MADLADIAISAWEKFEAHRKHLVYGRMTNVGIGLAHAVKDDCRYCVQFFLYGVQTVTWVDEAATGG